ncbi:hypothetical protein A4G27_09905 [Mycobacterium kansasii]|nr:hypothetical protein A4G27_09905 [Mycobacterium kansasii]
MTDQPGGPPVASGFAWGAGPAGPAVADQDSSGPTVLPGTRGTVYAVTYKRAPQQRLGGCIDHIEQILQFAMSFSGDI